jgi:hypothetical protein
LKWKVSGKPRYQEGARYYLQYAGFPEKLVYSTTKGTSDYKDDYQSRGEWVNYLMGAPNGPTDGRNTRGLNIPIDLALAFHTDAGTTMATPPSAHLPSAVQKEIEAFFQPDNQKWQVAI